MEHNSTEMEEILKRPLTEKDGALFEKVIRSHCLNANSIDARGILVKLEKKGIKNSIDSLISMAETNYDLGKKGMDNLMDDFYQQIVKRDETPIIPASKETALGCLTLAAGATTLALAGTLAVATSFSPVQPYVPSIVFVIEGTVTSERLVPRKNAAGQDKYIIDIQSDNGKSYTVYTQAQGKEGHCLDEFIKVGDNVKYDGYFSKGEHVNQMYKVDMIQVNGRTPIHCVYNRDEDPRYIKLDGKPATSLEELRKKVRETIESTDSLISTVEDSIRIRKE